MAMTRKDFEAIAAELKRQDPRPYDPEQVERSSAKYDEWATIVLGMATVCHDRANLSRNGNNLFDRLRFLKACGLAP
jgi:hypothetical protein